MPSSRRATGYRSLRLVIWYRVPSRPTNDSALGDHLTPKCSEYLLACAVIDGLQRQLLNAATARPYMRQHHQALAGARDFHDVRVHGVPRPRMTPRPQSQHRLEVPIAVGLNRGAHREPVP